MQRWARAALRPSGSAQLPLCFFVSLGTAGTAGTASAARPPRYIVDSKLLRKLAERSSPALNHWLSQQLQGGTSPSSRVYTTWLAEAVLREVNGVTTPLGEHIQVVGQEVEEGRLQALYRRLQFALPRAKHSRYEGKTVDFSRIVDELCDLMVAAEAALPGAAKRDPRVIVLDDNNNFELHSWLSKPDNLEALCRVLSDEGIPLPPIKWASELGMLDVEEAIRTVDGCVDFQKASASTEELMNQAKSKVHQPLRPDMAVRGDHDVYHDFVLGGSELGAPPLSVETPSGRPAAVSP
eukprot:RCo018497